MPQRLFQDVAGTIPASLPGDPVGLSIRAAGDVNATQGVALAKPTLVRWPATGRHLMQDRNVFDSIPLGVQSASNIVNGFGTSVSANGITVDVLDRGFDDGIPYIVIRVSGTNSTAAVALVDVGNTGIAPASGLYATVKATIALVAGTLVSTNDGLSLRGYVNFRQAGVTANGTTTTYSPSSSDTVFTAISTPTNGLAVDEVTNRGLYFRVPASATVDATVRIKGLQVSLGDVAPAFQVIRSPNNITQPGVPDKWHLYNDGGDSLSTVLPAGTYGTAHLIADGSYTFGTVVSDGSTPLTTIPNDRQVDAIYRLGAFNAEEQANILAYWQRKFPQ